MKPYARHLEQRFDGVAPRERVLVAIGMMAVLCYGYAMLFAGPSLGQRHRIASEIEALQTQVKTLDEALAALGKATSLAAQRAYRDGLRAQIEAVDKEMRGLQRTLVAPSEMPGLLRGVLSRNHDLKLISLRNAPVERLEPKPATAADAAPQRAIYRHTVEIRLSGSYAELHAYLAQLERMPWQMYWGRLDVETKEYPRLLATLTVHTLSLDKAWLAV